jgi:hypothetical protein
MSDFIVDLYRNADFELNRDADTEIAIRCNDTHKGGLPYSGSGYIYPAPRG